MGLIILFIVLFVIAFIIGAATGFKSEWVVALAVMSLFVVFFSFIPLSGKKTATEVAEEYQLCVYGINNLDGAPLAVATEYVKNARRFNERVETSKKMAGNPIVGVYYTKHYANYPLIEIF